VMTLREQMTTTDDMFASDSDEVLCKYYIVTATLVTKLVAAIEICISRYFSYAMMSGIVTFS